MNNYSIDNQDLYLHPLPMWVKGAVSISTTAVVVSTVAMTALLIIQPNMGIIGFSILGGSEGLSILTFALSYYLLNRKFKERLETSSILREAQWGTTFIKQTSSGEASSVETLSVPSAPENEKEEPQYSLEEEEGLPTTQQERALPSTELDRSETEEEHYSSENEEEISSVQVEEQKPPITESGRSETEEEHYPSENEEEIGSVQVEEQKPPITESGRSETEEEHYPSENEEEIGSVQVEEQKPPITESDRSETEEEQKPPSTESDRSETEKGKEISSPINPQKGEVVQTSEPSTSSAGPSIPSTPPLVFESIQQFQKAVLPPLFQEVEKLIIAFVCAYHRSIQKRISRTDVFAIKRAIGELKRIVIAFLNDKKQCFRFLLGVLVIKDLELETVKNLLNDKKTTIDAFIKNLPSIVSQDSEIKPLLEKIARTQKDLGWRERRSRNKLFNDLKSKYTNYINCRNMVNKTELNSALVKLVEWLFLHSKVELKDYEKIVSKELAPILSELTNVLLQNLVSELTDVIPSFSLDLTTAESAAFYGLTSFGGKGIRASIASAINMLTIEEAYKTRLKAVVNQLIPQLTNPLYYLIADNSHIFRKAFKANIFKSTSQLFRLTQSYHVFSKIDCKALYLQLEKKDSLRTFINNLHLFVRNQDSLEKSFLQEISNSINVRDRPKLEALYNELKQAHLKEGEDAEAESDRALIRLIDGIYLCSTINGEKRKKFVEELLPHILDTLPSFIKVKPDLLFLFFQNGPNSNTNELSIALYNDIHGWTWTEEEGAKADFNSLIKIIPLISARFNELFRRHGT